MRIAQLDIDGVTHRYLFLYESCVTQGPLQQDALTRRLGEIGSSRFYRLPNGDLGKLSHDRHAPWSLAWLTQDLLERRLIRAQAVREWRCNCQLAQLGIRTIPVHGVAIACHPLNPLGSLLVLPFLHEMTSGADHFRDADEQGRQTLLQQVARDVARAAHHGYGHRDLHLGNLMVDSQGEILWIDTHIRRLSRRPARRRQQLCESFHDSKLFGPDYRQQLQSLTLAYYDTL